MNVKVLMSESRFKRVQTSNYATMKKILIQLTTANELICYEAVSLAMTLATFEHQVQLFCDAKVFGILMNPASRIYGMLKSLPLYDMPVAWLPDDVFSGWLTGMVDEELAGQLDFVPEQLDLNEFDCIFNF